MGKQKMELSWENIDMGVINTNKRYAQKRIKLVSNASGKATNGLMAVMGPSGSGKSTLLKALAGRIPQGAETTGRVLVNGNERSTKKWLDEIGFVDQDDTIFESLTVYQTLEYAAKFRLKNKNVNIHERIEFLLQKLNIIYVSNCKMLNLSGGERKRVMVASE